jgi:ferricrocin synthase
VGIPLPTVGAYVLEDGKPVMRGALGELALSGPQLSSGYWNAPEINAKKFVWNGHLQERVYLTGDLVRHLADGTINFVGRNDDLVKLGGIRVELGEITSALRGADCGHEGLEVLLCKRKDGAGSSLVAFVARPDLEDGSGGPFQTREAKKVAQSVREYGQTVLPAYMLPSTFVIMPRIPRTASAKVDRVALTEAYHRLDLATLDSSEEPHETGTDSKVSAWHEQHTAVLDVIAQISGLPASSLRPGSTLAAVGIDSIGAIRLVPKINALGYAVSIVDVLKCRTLKDLCDLTAPIADQPNGLIDGHSNNGKLEGFDARYHPAVSVYLERDDLTIIPPTVLQESLLSESLKDPQAYWSSHLFDLAKDIDLAKLKRAWTKAAAQHEALRAAFVAKALLKLPSDLDNADDLSFLQIIYDEPEINWSEHDVTGSLESAAKRCVSNVASQCHQAIFAKPLWAVDIFRCENQVAMMLAIHHSIYDGPSLELLESDIRAHYLRKTKTTQQMSYSEAIVTKSALGANDKVCLDFWKSSLEDLDSEAGTTGHLLADGPKIEHRIQYLRSNIPISKVRQGVNALGLSSVSGVYRTACALILSELLESPHCFFAEIMSERVVDGRLQNVIGPLLSVVPVVFKRPLTALQALSEQESFSKLAWAHRNVRPGTISTLLKRSPGSHLYPAMFAFHPGGGDDDESASLWERMQDVTNIQVEHPLAFNVWQDSAECPNFELAVPDFFMSAAEQDLLLRQLDALIAAMLEHPRDDLVSLADTFSSGLLSRTTPRKDTKCPSPYHTTYYIEHWAEIHPEWKAAEIALKIDPAGNETESWTYAELNAQSNKVAHLLMEQGLTARMVAICLGRTLLSYAVVLGILKSGNTYLPIDESLPVERKALLLEDSSAAAVFTTPELFENVPVPERCQVINVDASSFKQSLSAMDSSNPLPNYTPDDNAYLLYTSGSTGKPKGVLVSHRNLSSFLEAELIIPDHAATRALAGKGKYLGLASRAFDVHICEMFLAWRHGFAAVTATRTMFLDDLALTLSSLHITHASFVPSLLDQTGLTPDDAPDLVYLSVGGEKMSAKTKKLWGSHDRVTLINAYGPTEATIGICSGRVLRDSDIRDIGTPVGDSVGHVLIPDTDHYALRGMPGELCFTGSLVANGYLNRPDAKGFVQSPYGKMYRTGLYRGIQALSSIRY